MKPKTPNGPRGRAGKGKMVKKEITQEDINSPAYLQTHPKPSVEIVHCISFQKFRYSGENRPGKKYQDKDFMELKLCHLQDKVVRVVIICTDAENRELIHPNGLVGKDCHDGIYDKEYAITESVRKIKIPYLRTERIKTKKNEYENIRKVLIDRASHLPSPYKERCQSQCTDRYTASRKFDTTKVCLGVIVTVQSHQGGYNGSLHAISHVVRNASEKTSLSILKLSENMINAYNGATIDIFTTEDGPAIEPEKYEIYVSCHSPEFGFQWESERYKPEKRDILYQRIITYKIPPLEPVLELGSPLEAYLHLACPQSNQSTECKFLYTSHGEIVVVEEENFNGHKRALIEHDIKPSVKRLRTETPETEAIKANLKNKLKARQEGPNEDEEIYVESQAGSQGEIRSHYIIDGHQQILPAHVENYPHGQHVLIRRQDPQTGEPSVLLDMDANKNESNSGGHTYTFGENQQFAVQLPDRNATHEFVQEVKAVGGKGSPFPSHSSDVQVVAAGYSEDVPPNTTVYIYTTNGSGTPDHAVINAATREQIVTQAVTESDPRWVQHATSTTNGPTEQSYNYVSVGEKRIVVSQAPGHQSVVGMANSGKMIAQSLVTESGPKDCKRMSPSISQSGSDIVMSSSPSSSVSSQYRAEFTSSPSTIPPIRRMLLPNKRISQVSPWEVGDSDETDRDLSMVMRSFASGSYDKRTPSHEIKKESSEEESFPKRHDPVTRTRPVAEKHMENLVTTEAQQISVTAAPSGIQQSSSQAPGGISATTDTMALAYQLSKLPTDDIMKIAEKLQNGAIPSIAEEENSEGGQEK